MCFLPSGLAGAYGLFTTNPLTFGRLGGWAGMQSCNSALCLEAKSSSETVRSHGRSFEPFSNFSHDRVLPALAPCQACREFPPAVVQPASGRSSQFPGCVKTPMGKSWPCPRTSTCRCCHHLGFKPSPQALRSGQRAGSRALMRSPISVLGAARALTVAENHQSTPK